MSKDNTNVLLAAFGAKVASTVMCVSFFISAALSVLIMGILLVSCCMSMVSCGPERARIAALDEAQMWRVGEDGEDVMLWSKCPTSYNVDKATLSIAPVRAAVMMWNNDLGAPIVKLSSGAALITVDMGYVPNEGWQYGEAGDADRLGLADITYNKATGEITRCKIRVNVDYFSPPRNRTTQRFLELTLAHEFGHCLSLADDPGPPPVVSLRSRMSDPLDPLGELTRGDKAIIREMCAY